MTVVRLNVDMVDSVPRYPGLDGGVAVAIALGLTELVAGLTARVPSAIASVGAVIVDLSPPVVKDVAIGLLGTADKGALAIGTVIASLLIGIVVGRRSVTHRWVAMAAFGLFGLLGIGAQLRAPMASPVLVVLSTSAAAAAGYGVLRVLHALDARAFVEDPTDGRIPDGDRRRFMVAAAGVGVGAVALMAFGRSQIIGRSEATRLAVGLPSPLNPAPAITAANELGLEGLTPIVEATKDFYRIDTALVVPVIDAASWTLRVSGMVEREVELTLEDIYRMEQLERYVTISCVSNEVGDDLVGNARWQGVRLTEILDMARPLPGADQIVPRSIDGWTAGFPTELAYDGRDPIVAVGMNSAALPRDHGYPARLIVPGLYGYVSATKWLTEIELTTWDGFDAYWVPRGWAKEAPIKTQSRIDRPSGKNSVPAGAYTAAGVAWAPTRGIAGVEVQLDDGAWREAVLSRPLSNDAWVQWMVDLDLDPGAHRLRVRATDGDGVTQTEEIRPPRPDGATGWHSVTFDVREA